MEVSSAVTQPDAQSHRIAGKGGWGERCPTHRYVDEGRVGGGSGAQPTGMWMRGPSAPCVQRPQLCQAMEPGRCQGGMLSELLMEKSKSGEFLFL